MDGAGPKRSLGQRPLYQRQWDNSSPPKLNVMKKSITCIPKRENKENRLGIAVTRQGFFHNEPALPVKNEVRHQTSSKQERPGWGGGVRGVRDQSVGPPLRQREEEEEKTRQNRRTVLPRPQRRTLFVHNPHLPQPFAKQTSLPQKTRTTLGHRPVSFSSSLPFVPSRVSSVSRAQAELPPFPRKTSDSSEDLTHKLETNVLLPLRVPLSVQRAQLGLPPICKSNPQGSSEDSTCKLQANALLPLRVPLSVQRTQLGLPPVCSRNPQDSSEDSTSKIRSGVFLPQRVPSSGRRALPPIYEEPARSNLSKSKAQTSIPSFLPQRVPISVQKRQQQECLEKEAPSGRKKWGISIPQKRGQTKQQQPLRASLSTSFKPRRTTRPSQKVETRTTQTKGILKTKLVCQAIQQCSIKKPCKPKQLCFGPLAPEPKEDSSLDFTLIPLEDTIVAEATLVGEAIEEESCEEEETLKVQSKEERIKAEQLLTFSSLKQSLPFLCTPKLTPTATPSKLRRNLLHKVSTPHALRSISWRVKMSIAALYEEEDDEGEDVEVSCVTAGLMTAGAASSPPPAAPGYFCGGGAEPSSSSSFTPRRGGHPSKGLPSASLFAPLHRINSADDEEIVGLLHQTHLAEDLKAGKTSMLRRTLVHQAEERFQEALLDEEVRVYTCGESVVERKGSGVVGEVSHLHHQAMESASALSPQDRRGLSNPVAQVLRESEERQFVPIESELESLQEESELSPEEAA